MQMFSVMLYYYLLFFHDTLVKFNKYFVVMMKILTLGLFCFACMLPVQYSQCDTLHKHLLYN